MNDLIYKPPETPEKPPEATFGVKFAQNITYLESFLKQQNIPYEQSDLEDTPLGRGYVVRKDTP